MSLFSSDSLPERFPEVRATTLDGEELLFPADLPAPLTLVVVSFHDDMDPLSDQWARLGHEIEVHYPEQFAIIETPVVGRGMKLFGSLATAGIRGQIDDPREHARTFPIYVDKKPFRKSLKLKNQSEVYAILVERHSERVLWIGDGAIDISEIQSLEAMVERTIPTLAQSIYTPASGDQESEADTTTEPDESAPEAVMEQSAAEARLPSPEATEDAQPTDAMTSLEEAALSPEAAGMEQEVPEEEPPVSAVPLAPAPRRAPDPFPLDSLPLGKRKSER